MENTSVKYSILEAAKPYLEGLTIRDLAIDGHDLVALGLTGPAIGNCQKDLLRLVLEEQIPNEKAALLAAARRFLD